MKKNWMIGVMLLGVLTAQAQWKITPEAGFNITKSAGNPAKIGYKIGAAIQYDWGETGFGLQSGLYYVQRGEGVSSLAFLHGKNVDAEGNEMNMYWSFDHKGMHPLIGYYPLENPNNYNYQILPYTDWQSITFYKMGGYRYGYLQLPILARYNWKLNGKTHFHIALGPYLAVGVNGKAEMETTNIIFNEGNISSYESHKYNPFDKEKQRFDWGIAAETGVEINRFSAKFSYDMGLGKEYKYDEIGCKYHTASFTIGYSF